jgi:hypothetical protein
MTSLFTISSFRTSYRRRIKHKDCKSNLLLLSLLHDRPSLRNEFIDCNWRCARAYICGVLHQRRVCAVVLDDVSGLLRSLPIAAGGGTLLTKERRRKGACF